MGQKKIKINMWYGHPFSKKQYGADATFYPHGCFGYSYCGNIFDGSGKMIGDYAAIDSQVAGENFNIDWIG